MSLTPIDQLWLLSCGGLVLLMQAGFLCLEAGLTRSKNAVNVALKNLVDLTLTPLVFVSVGAGVMYGASWWGLCGKPWAFGAQPTNGLFAFLLFQTLLCTSAVTIVSGAVAERMRFGAYIAVCLLLGGVVYPLVGHWVWGSVWSATPGWLEGLGFDDFAGAGVVHMTGGFAGLAGAIAIGPRVGRFAPERLDTGFPKHSLPTAMLGVILLCVGWIGFNGGSTLRFNDSIGLVLLNTLLAGSAGGAAALAVSRSMSRVFSPEAIINGLLAGLVAVCALADVASPLSSVLVGAAAGVSSFAAAAWLVRRRIDDVVGAFPVHGVGGVVGILLQPAMPAAHLGLGEVLVQALGGAVIAGTAFVPAYLLLRKGMPLAWRRVSPEEEGIGLNLAEHGVESELQTLLRSLLAVREVEKAAALPIDASDDAGMLAATLNDRVSQAFRDGELATHAQAQQKQAEELREYGEFLHAVLNGIEKQICILDRQGRIVETNRAWNRFFDLIATNRGARVGVNFVDFCRESEVYSGNGAHEIAEAVQLITEGRVGRFQAEYSLQARGGEHIVELTIHPLTSNDRGAVIITQRDRTPEHRIQQQIILEKQKAERLAAALEASQASLDLAMKGANLGFWHWDLGTGYFELSLDWLETLGFDDDELNSDINEFRALLHADEQDLWTPADAATLSEGEAYDRQFRLRLPDGSYRWVQVLGRAVSSTANNRPESLSGVLIDIDARKSAELRDAGMAKIIEESNNLVFVIDSHTGKFVEVNRGARENLGYSLDELRSMTPFDITPAEAHTGVRKRLSDIFAGVETRINFEAIHVRRDGTTYPAELCIQPSRLLDREVIVCIGTDVSHRRELERQLAEARRLESIGQLSAGIAHEMNTPLQFVSNNIEFLRDGYDSLAEVFEAIERFLEPLPPPVPWDERRQAIEDAMTRSGYARIRKETPKAISESQEGIERVLQIVRAMREFTHPGDQRHTPTDLNRAITSTATVTRNRWKNVGVLELDLDPYLPQVECQGTAVNQVFVNLILNAADAIAQRRQQDAEAPAGRILIRSYYDDNRAIFEVQDNGCGMSPEVQRRAFDPFFTTKEVGKGTGQGLSLSHAIVTKTHGGGIEIDSTLGEGTLVRVSLPISQSGASAEASVRSIEDAAV